MLSTVFSSAVERENTFITLFCSRKGKYLHYFALQKKGKMPPLVYCAVEGKNTSITAHTTVERENTFINLLCSRKGKLLQYITLQ
jgi:hypothetical protein